MPRYDATTARCTVLTFKEGLLSKVAHDLKIVIERFEIQIDGEGAIVGAMFDTGSLRVDCARREGRDAVGLLSLADKKEIEGRIREDVLHCRRYPEARFTSTGVIKVSPTRRRIVGELDLHGRKRSIELEAGLKEDQWNAEISLHQPDFGIEPYRAMLGALRVRPDVRIAISIPAG